MASIKITDNLNAEITSVPLNQNPFSSLIKYVKVPAVNLIFLPGLVSALKRPLLTASNEPVEFGLNFKNGFQFGNVAPEINIGAGASAAVHVNAIPGTNVFQKNPFASPVPVDDGTGYASLAIAGSVSVGLDRTVSDLTFGIDAGKSLTVEYFRAFRVTDASPTVAEAVGDVISNYTIPADIADLKAMNTGDICTVAGSGRLGLSVGANLLAAVNPLSSVSLPLNLTAPQIKAGASLDATASVEVSGDYLVRVRKLDAGTIELGYFRNSEREFTVSLTASAGVSAGLGKLDLISKLMRAISKDPEADIEALVNSGLSDAEIGALQKAVAASIDRTLQVSVQAAFSSMRSDEAAFLYSIDLNALDADANSSQAVHLALDGDLSEMNRLESGMQADGTIAPGIRLLRSRFVEMRKRGTSLRVNLIGILNFSRVSELISKGEVLFEPVTGDLTISETAKSESVSVLTEPFRADGDKLQKAMFDSLLVTTVYRATRAAAPLEMSSSQVHFATNDNSTRQTISDYLDGFIGLDLIAPADKPRLLGPIVGKARSNYMLRTEFDDQACTAMFLDPAGNPRDPLFYERVGREALTILLQPGDPDDPGGIRRATVQNEDLWRQSVAEGVTKFISLLPDSLRNSPLRQLVVGDFLLIEWWVDAMQSSGKLLADMRAFLQGKNAETLRNDNQFKKKSQALQEHMMNVVAQSKVRFHDPWGLIALYRTVGARAATTGVILSPLLTRIDHKDKAQVEGV